LCAYVGLDLLVVYFSFSPDTKCKPQILVWALGCQFSLLTAAIHLSLLVLETFSAGKRWNLRVVSLSDLLLQPTTQQWWTIVSVETLSTCKLT